MGGAAGADAGYERSLLHELIVVAVASFIFVGCAVSPPSLMDDVDAVQAQIARNMLDSGDWVTARLNGVAYLEKAPLKYWMIAASFKIFGVSDLAARTPIVLATVALCWLTARIGSWAFSPRAGFYAGLVLSTSTGLFLFTRILIPDVVLTLVIALSMWAFLRLIEEDGWRWPAIFWASLGVGFLLKGLIAILFPAGAVVVYFAITRGWKQWRLLRPAVGLPIALVIALPWVVLATLRNPPYFDFTMHSSPGEYRGFFWFFFLNEHLLRFLNMRHPRDYNTVPRLLFWGFHVLWLFPWSGYLPGAFSAAGLSERGRRTRRLAICWTGFLLVFFTFSTTQEYYSMPCYPALALLLGSAIDREGPWIRAGARFAGCVAVSAAVVLLAISWTVRGTPVSGDIASALTSNPEAYTLSLGHMQDLTLNALAHLRKEMLLAAIAFLAGAMGVWFWRPIPSLVAMMVLFLHAARLAMVTFDPYLGSRSLAEALEKSPPGEIVFDNQYYTFSSVFFYANVRGWLWNGRVNNLEYGSYAPGAPNVFLDDRGFDAIWRSGRRCYLLIEGPSMAKAERLVGKESLRVVHASGGKYLLTNQ
jgi:4-amino-4-deoxy-L-arabinose transferase-like glycosyltransferase